MERVDVMNVNVNNSPDGQNLYNECNKMMHYHILTILIILIKVCRQCK